jgi:hypothetical protein
MAQVNLYVQANASDPSIDSNGYYRLKLNQMPADIDTLHIKGVYLQLKNDTTGVYVSTNTNVLLMDVPDLNVLTVSNVNQCINKIVIPTWGNYGLDDRTILYWFEVPVVVKPSYLGYDRFSELKIRFTDVNGATGGTGAAAIVQNFGLWAYAKL